MQLTKFDRWIRRTFIDKTEVLLLRKPDFRLPLSSKLKKLPKEAGRYKFLLSFANEDQAQNVIKRLKSANMSYSVRVKEKSNFFAAYMKGNKRSCTHGCIWIFVILGLIAGLIYLVYSLSDRPLMQKILKELKFYWDTYIGI